MLVFNFINSVKYLLATLVLMFTISFSSLPVSASEIYNEKDLETQASNSTFVRRTASYSKNQYCEFKSCLNKNLKPFPRQIWVTTSGGYAGYIPVEDFSISSTHIIVIYSGNIPKAPYAPSSILEDK